MPRFKTHKDYSKYIKSNKKELKRSINITIPKGISLYINGKKVKYA
jgi:hypothetical protein